MLKKFELILGLDEIDKILDHIPDSGILILNGDLGSGKTTLVKKIGAKFNIDENSINSPTFSIMQNYGKIFHYDIYNVGFDGLMRTGLAQNFFEDGLHIVEWGDEKLINYLKKFEFEIFVIKISTDKNLRKYEVFSA